MTVGYVNAGRLKAEELENQRRGQDLTALSNAASNATELQKAKMGAGKPTASGVDALKEQFNNQVSAYKTALTGGLPGSSASSAPSAPTQGASSTGLPGASSNMGTTPMGLSTQTPDVLGASLGAQSNPVTPAETQNPLTRFMTGLPPLSTGKKRGGVVEGPQGLDQVAAEGPQGEPVRLSDGEYILPVEVVEALGGVEALDQLVESITGEAPVPGGEPMPPLPEQMDESMVPAAQGGGAADQMLDAAGLAMSSNPASWGLRALVKAKDAGENADKPRYSERGQKQLSEAQKYGSARGMMKGGAAQAQGLDGMVRGFEGGGSRVSYGPWSPVENIEEKVQERRQRSFFGRSPVDGDPKITDEIQSHVQDNTPNQFRLGKPTMTPDQVRSLQAQLDRVKQQRIQAMASEARTNFEANNREPPIDYAGLDQYMRKGGEGYHQAQASTAVDSTGSGDTRRYRGGPPANNIVAQNDKNRPLNISSYGQQGSQHRFFQGSGKGTMNDALRDAGAGVASGIVNTTAGLSNLGQNMYVGSSNLGRSIIDNPFTRGFRGVPEPETQPKPASAPQSSAQQPAPAANAKPAPQTPAASLRAQINQPQPRTEQQLLDEISGQPGGLRRMADIGRGNVFRYEDPAAMRPGTAAPVESRSVPIQRRRGLSEVDANVSVQNNLDPNSVEISSGLRDGGYPSEAELDAWIKTGKVPASSQAANRQTRGLPANQYPTTPQRRSMQSNADPAERRHPMTGELMGGSASQMRREGGRFNHLPISSVTYSDSIGGTGIKADGQAAQDLQALYNRDAANRTETAKKAGLDAAMYPASGPAVDAGFRGQQIQLQRELQQQQPQRQAMGLEALKLQGEIAKAKAGRADADPRKDVWQVAMDNHFPKNEDDPNGSRRAQAQAFMSKIRPILEMQGITLDPNQLAAGLNLALTEGTNEDGVLDEMKVMNALTKYVGPDFVQLLSRQ